MRPTLRQLQYLVAVSETGRFNEAAKRVNVSQPSLSAQIADVEQQLGVQLVERGRKGALMTPMGEEFVRRAKRILRDVEDLKFAMQTENDALVGRVRLGVVPSIGPYLLPTVVSDLHRSYPNLRLMIQEQWADELDRGLLDGALDCAISTPERHPSLAHARLFEEPLWVCAAPDDPLRGQGPVTADALKGRELLSVGKGGALRETVEHLAEIAGAKASGIFSGTSLDAIRHMAATGAGVAILPAIYAIAEARRDADLVLRPLAHPDAKREVALVWRQTSPLIKTYEAMAEILRADAEAILAQPFA